MLNVGFRWSWPHAELTISNGPFAHSAPLPGRAPAHSWSRMAGIWRLEPNRGGRDLHHASSSQAKILSSPEVQHRLAYYEDILAAPGNRLDGDPLDLHPGGTLTHRRSQDGKLAASPFRSRADGCRGEILRLSPLLDRARRRLGNVVIGGDGMPFSPIPMCRPRRIRQNDLVSTLADRHGFGALRIQECIQVLFIVPELFSYKGRVCHTRRTRLRTLLTKTCCKPSWRCAVFRWWPLIITSSIGRFLREPGRPTIVVDRYFWDYLVKVRHPMRLHHAYRVKRLSKLVPEPRKAVVLCCKFETLNSRKNELRPEAVDFLYDFYCEQIAQQGETRACAVHGWANRAVLSAGRVVLTA